MKTVQKLLVGVAVLIAVGALLAILVTWLTPGVWVGEKHAISVLQNYGFREIVINDKDVLLVRYSGCSRDDDALFEATALNPANKKVNVIVCSGWPFKGGTVRTK